MGHFRGDSEREMGFPDEFGEDMCQERGEQPTPAGKPRADTALLRVCDPELVRPLPALPSQPPGAGVLLGD